MLIGVKLARQTLGLFSTSEGRVGGEACGGAADIGAAGGRGEGGGEGEGVDD